MMKFPSPRLLDSANEPFKIFYLDVYDTPNDILIYYSENIGNG